MDGLISNLKSKFAPKTEQEEEQDDKRLEAVHDTLAKVDPNTMDSTMVDVEDMTSLTDVSHDPSSDNQPKLDDIRTTNSKTNNSTNLIREGTVAAFSVFQTPGENKEESDEQPNPLEDDIFIYYD